MTRSYTLVVLFLVASACMAQKASPAQETTGTIGPAKITVNYSAPSVKGRTVWGELEPYGKVWRTGADEATRVTFDRDVMVEGKPLPAGEYALFTIPGEEEWVVIFNNEAKQWGAYNYNASKDALRVTTRPRKLPANQEQLKFVVKDQGNSRGELAVQWEMVEVPVTVSVK